MRKLPVLLMFFISFMASSIHADTHSSRLLASVDSQPISVDSVLDYVKINPLMSGHLGTPDGLARVLNDMINVRLLNLEGKKQAIPRLNDASDGAYAMAVKSRLVEKCERPDEAGGKAFYDSHPELFSTPAYVRLEKAYLKQTDMLEGQTASAFMQAQAEALRANRVNFGDLVSKIRPKIPAEIVLGDIGFMPLTENDALVEQLKQAAVGDVIGPIDRDGNIYLFQVTDRRDPVVAEWKDALTVAQDAALNQCEREKFAQLRKKMESNFPVVIFEENIRSLKFN